MEKKLISFSDEQLEGINTFAEKYKKTFTESVRRLIDLGLKTKFDEPDDRIVELQEQIEKLSWWTSDDNTSKIGNMETQLEEMQKQINVITAAMKLFKKHLKNREIHLQD